MHRLQNLWSSPPAASCTIWKVVILIFLKILHLIMGSPVISVGYWHSDKYGFCVLFFWCRCFTADFNLLMWITECPVAKACTHSDPGWAGLLVICSQSYTIAFSESGSCSVVSDFGTPRTVSPPVSSVHGLLQARILECVAIPFSRGSSRPRDPNQVSCFAGRFFTVWATREAFSRMMAILWQFNKRVKSESLLIQKGQD